MDVCVNINNISIEMEMGKIKFSKIAFIGENGTGKTSLFKCFCGMYMPTSGYIKYNDNVEYVFPLSYFKYRDWIKFIKKNVLYIGHTSLFYEDLSIIQNIIYFSGIGHFNSKKILEDIRRYKVDESLEKPIKFLSDGTKQKLLIIFGINTNKSYIFFDEPDKNIDSETIERFYADINNLNEKSVFITTHRTKEEMEQIVDKVFVLRKDKVK